jgi:phosphoribosyl 1,2-cyclic phosphodiesterase
MTGGAIKRKGILAAGRSVLKGGPTAEAAISNFHQGLPERVVEVLPGTEFNVGDMRIIGTGARHSDIDSVGFRFKTNVGDIGYTSDTEFFKETRSFFQDLKVLILCVLRPSGEPWKGHMTTDDAIEIIKNVSPQLAVLTHFGMKMLLRGSPSEAKRVERESGVKTVAAKDGMELIVNEEVKIASKFNERMEMAELDRFLRNEKEG